MIDLELETLIPIAKVPGLKCLPSRRQGKRLHPSTVWRWALHGIRGRRLETIKVGGQRCTTLGALKRFFAEEPSGASRANHATLPDGPKGKSRKAVEQELDALGI